MPSPARHVCRLLIAAVSACALAAGCAGLPRIDPTGERVFIWPKDQPQVAPIGAVQGNFQAPPVGTDAVFPSVPVVAPPTPPAATVPPVAATTIVPTAAAVAPVTDRLTMTPERVLAPVGSEVVLKASICTPDGYTLADQKVEWMLGRNGVGQFVELGGKGLFHPPLLPFLRGAKVDNYFAHGYTANGPLCITRGTADPSDDVNINRGDAWVSVTSPNEGTSHVTAYTPEVADWNQRRATATIYWVDVQWTFPPATIASSGRPEQLTTTVTRQSDGTPLAGWIVRYAVADSGTVAGDAGTGVVEIATGADGRASVQVSPTAAGAAASKIDIQLIRPAGFGGGDAPRLVVGEGSTIVQWSGAQPYLPSESPTPAPSIPGAPAPASPSPSPPVSPSAGQPRLELIVRPSQTQLAVGETVNYEISVRNIGAGTATGGVVSVLWDTGLNTPADTQGTGRVNWPREGATLTIAPNQTETVAPLPFTVNKSGQQCVTVTVNYAEGQPITQRVCVNAVEAAPLRTPRVEVSITGPEQAAKGGNATFQVRIKNTGDVPLVDIYLDEEYPTGIFQPRPTDANDFVVQGVIRHAINRLEPGQSRDFSTVCLCLQETARARVLVRATAQTEPRSVEVPSADEIEVRVTPPGAPAQPGGVFPPDAGGVGAAGNLSPRIDLSQKTVQAGARVTCSVTLANKSTLADSNVSLAIAFPQTDPATVTPDVNGIEGPTGITAELRGSVLSFSPVRSMPAGEVLRFVIPLNVNNPGIVPIQARAVSDRVTTPVEFTEQLEIVRRSL